MLRDALLNRLLLVLLLLLLLLLCARVVESLAFKKNSSSCNYLSGCALQWH